MDRRLYYFIFTIQNNIYYKYNEKSINWYYINSTINNNKNI